MDLTFIPYDPAEAEPKQSKKHKRAKKNPSSTAAPTSTADNAPPNSSTLPPTTDVVAPGTPLDGVVITPAPTPVLVSSTASPVPTTVPSATTTQQGPSTAPSDTVNDSQKKKKNINDFIEIPEEGVPPAQPGIRGWPERNPDRPVIPLRTGRSKQNAETLVTAKMKRDAKRDHTEKLTAAIENIIKVRNEMAEQVAEAHGVKPELVLQRLMSLGSRRASRKITLFNAKVHSLCKRQKRLGRPIKLKEARRRVQLDPEWEDIDEEAEKAMREDLLLHREVQKHGARVTGTACMVDARHTTGSFMVELEALAERTGMIGFAFFTRTHVHDKTVPVEMGSWGALDLFPEVLKTDSRDVGAKFELWAIARDQGVLGAETLGSMCKEIVKYNDEGVKLKSGKKKFRLNWSQYWTVMVVKNHLMLRGWPLDRPVCNPYDIKDIDSMRKVRNAMREGSCFWHRLTDSEWEREKAKVDQMLEDGEIEAKQRKSRSDKNTKRKSRKSPEREPQVTRSQSNKKRPRRVWNEDSEGEEDRETEKSRKSKKCSRVEVEGRDTDEPPRKRKRMLKSSKSSSETPDRFQEMQKKLRKLAKAKYVSTQLPATVRGSRRSGPPGIRATAEEHASVE
ncbi:hypothetical protein B0H16DRAFT_1732607 [Mycena metata]|uniref:Uncharacterized protein n=1 Tax=Mycena metata TaxID=1033252 RepID=A0AAD7I1F5_9AGAR|nr:hypothetical protein B0H16DRAFT_1732607 [Mycena metata]